MQIQTSPELELDRSDPSGAVVQVYEELGAQQQARAVADERVEQAVSSADGLEHSQRRLLDQDQDRDTEAWTDSARSVVPVLERQLQAHQALLRANDEVSGGTRQSAEGLRSRIGQGQQATDSRRSVVDRVDREFRLADAHPLALAELTASGRAGVAKLSLAAERDQARLRANEGKLDSLARTRWANVRQADRRRAALQSGRERLKDLADRRRQLGSRLAEVSGSREGVEKSRRANDANSKAARANEADLQELANRLSGRTGRKGELGEPDPTWERQIRRDELPDGSAGARPEPESARPLSGTAGVRDHGERISVRLEQLTQGLSALYGQGGASYS